MKSKSILRIFCLIILILTVNFVLLDSANAQSTDWINPGVGDWGDVNNWSGGVPTGLTDVYINNGGTAQILPSIFRVSATLIVGDGAEGNLQIQGVNGLLTQGHAYIGHDTGGLGTVNVQGNWSISGELFMSDGPGTSQLDVSGNGHMSSDSGQISGAFGSNAKVSVTGASASWNNTNLMEVGRQGSGTLNITQGGTVTTGAMSIGSYYFGGFYGTGSVVVKGANSLLNVNNSLTVGEAGVGVLEISDGGTVDIGVNSLILGGSSPASNGTLKIGNGGAAGSLVASEVRNANGSASIEFDSTGANNFNIPINGGMTVKQLGGTTVLIANNTYTGDTTVTGGQLRVMGSTGTGNVYINGGSLTGSGTINGDVTINGGFLSPQAWTQSMILNGDLTVSSGFIAMQVAGSGKTAYDDIIVNGLASLSNTLTVSLVGYTPVLGNSFDLFDWNGGVTGTFSNLNLPTLNPGLFWDTTNLYTTGTLTVVPEPATWVLLFLGFISLGFAVVRSRKNISVL